MNNKILMAGLALLPVLASAAGRADFNGVWQIKTPVSQLQTTAGTLPPLLPAARKLYEQRLAKFKAGDHGFDATQTCKPMGEPRTAYDPEGGPFEILVNPKVVVFGYTWNRMIRFVYVKDAAPDPIGPTYYGTATARWQGQTLIVSAVDFHDTTLLDASGLPHSEQLKLTESYQLSGDGNELHETLRIEDPNTFSMPWETQLVYQRRPGAHLAEDVCIERRGITQQY